MVPISDAAKQKLETARNVWFASVRPDGRPHLTPVWFSWTMEHLYISIDPSSVKARNLARNPRIVVALEDGDHPVICEGRANPIVRPYPGEVLAAFQLKYDWDLDNDPQYNWLVELIPEKWLEW